MAEQELQIEYSHEGFDYRVHLKLRALDGIFDAAQDPAIREKKGEELVDALIESQKGNVISASRYRNNKRNDGANGEPQYQEFDENGTLRKAMHYNEGDRHNAADGSPGLAEFYPDGEVKTVIYYTYRAFNDGPQGQPAYQSFNPDGTLHHAANYSHHSLRHQFTAAERNSFKPPETQSRQALTKKKFGAQQPFGN